jgi:hypothetical protein
MQRRVILAFALAAACCALAVATGAAAFAAKAPAGHWGSARGVSGAVAAMAGGGAQAEVQSVSCASAGNCVAGGSAMTTGPFSDAFLADEVKGRWGGAREVPGLAAINHGSAQVDTVSCAAAGDCAALGGYVDASGLTQVFVTEEKNGSWSDAQPLPGLAFLNRRGLAFVHSVSCAAPGDCVAVGSYLGAGGFTQAYEAEEAKGAWLDAQPVNGVPSLNSGNSGSTAVSCVSLGNCTVAGFYSDISHHEQVFVADESAGTATSLALSAAKIRFGHEQAEKISVKVTGRTGGTPGGKVTVKAGSATICVITLAHGKGACTLAARKLRPGSYRLTAVYGGSGTYAGSASRTKTISVVK